MPKKSENLKLWNSNKPYFTDPVDRARHKAFNVSRCQARFRGEEWELTLEEFFSVWTPLRWSKRNRSSSGLMMTRRDTERAWSIDNVYIIDRRKYYTSGQHKKKSKVLP